METVSEWVDADGTVSVAEVTSSTAIGCFELAVATAVDAGFSWNTEPIRLQPSPRLVGLIEKGDSAAVVADDGDG